MRNLLYSLVLELSATSNVVLPRTTGHQAHALFLTLISQVDPALAQQLHNEPNYRPFTVSPLYGATEQGKTLLLSSGQKCQLRITLLDSSNLWDCLTQQFVENPNLTFHLGSASLMLRRVYSTSTLDPHGWSATTDWQTLASTTAREFVTLRFASPTAFNLGDRHFALFPEPAYVWDSLMRSWNSYAPEIFRLEKTTIREFVAQQIRIRDYTLHTETLTFPKFIQKGFVGICTYQMKTRDGSAPQAIALAEFARYSGVGYKTTMGMGQVRCEGEKELSDEEEGIPREAQVWKC